MIPLYDRNPTRTTPVVTIILMAACIAIYFFIQPHHTDVEDAEFTYHRAAIPCELIQGGPITEREVRTDDCSSSSESAPIFPDKNVYLAILYSMFLHGSLMHLAGNMLFLWVFGNNIEDYLGKVKFVLFYFLGGLAATFAHVLTHLDSVSPGVGASGAVAAVMGAYLLLYPKARVSVLVTLFIFITVVQLSAVTVLGIWFLYQFLYAYQEASVATGVAWMAHVGGFLFGLVGIFLLGGRPHRPAPAWDPRWGGYG